MPTNVLSAWEEQASSPSWSPALAATEVGLYPNADGDFVVENSSGIKKTVYSQRLITANSGATYAIDLSLANVFHITLTASCTFTFTNVPDVSDFTLLLDENGTGGYTATFPTALWNAGIAPTLNTTAGNKAVLTFMTIDGGSTWYGFLAGDGFA